MSDQPLSIIVVGASGNLARKKVIPALFSMYSQGQLPDDVHFFGFARSQMTDQEFREMITQHLTCRYTPEASDCAGKMMSFLERCHYVSGQYADKDSYLDLYQAMQEQNVADGGNCLFYLAIPPLIFADVVNAIGGAGFVQCGESDPWSRIVIEKPFGRDRASSDKLVDELGSVFSEEQTYRIDHYLGKEVIQNLLVLRFANLIFEPLWNSKHIEKIEISWKEDLTVEGRGGYFDEYGIIRDVIQNHLLQILSLVAMDPPEQLEAAYINRRKVELLKCVETLKLSDVVIGQYEASDIKGRHVESYREDPTVPDKSITPTYAAALLKINNERWKGVPFLVTAGKGLDERCTEIRIKFRHVPENIFCATGVCPPANEMIIRVQPDESIMLNVSNKIPGAGMKIDVRALDLQYDDSFKEIIPDAYESLILDVVEGDKSLFIGSSELAAAWDIFTPVLHEIDEKGVEPVPYPFGSTGPDVSHLR